MSDQITQALDAMQARCDAATPGPWEAEKGGESHCGDGCCSEWWDNRIWADRLVLAECYLWGMGDVEFIAAARTDMPRLIAALKAVLAQHYLHDCSPEHGSWCSPCWSEGLCEGCSEDWPCPTVKSITEALGGEAMSEPTDTLAEYRLTPGLGVVVWRCLRCGISGAAPTDTAARFACHDHNRACKEAER